MTLEPRRGLRPLFVFDLDNVLYGYDWRIRMQIIGEITGLTLDELNERWWNEGGQRKADCGGFPTAESCLSNMWNSGVALGEDDWIVSRRMSMSPWPASIQTAAHAASLGRITLLSNNCALTEKSLPKLAPELVPIFGSHLKTSASYGCCKPSPDVFSRVMEAYGVTPQDTFFVDDMRESVDAASSIGITAQHFTTPSSLRVAIDEFFHLWQQHSPTDATTPATPCLSERHQEQRARGLQP